MLQFPPMKTLPKHSIINVYVMSELGSALIDWRLVSLAPYVENAYIFCFRHLPSLNRTK